MSKFVIINSLPLDLSLKHLRNLHVASRGHFLDVNVVGGVSIVLFPESICNFFKINGGVVLSTSIWSAQEIFNALKSNLDLVLSLWDRDQFSKIIDTCIIHCFRKVITLTWFSCIASLFEIEIVEVLKWLIF